MLKAVQDWSATQWVATDRAALSPADAPYNETLIYGGSDDDIFFGDHTDTLTFRFNSSP